MPYIAFLLTFSFSPQGGQEGNLRIFCKIPVILSFSAGGAGEGNTETDSGLPPRPARATVNFKTYYSFVCQHLSSGYCLR